MAKNAWSTPLPRPIKIPQVMTLKTLADVRRLISHIPKERLVTAVRNESLTITT